MTPPDRGPGFAKRMERKPGECGCAPKILRLEAEVKRLKSTALKFIDVVELGSRERAELEAEVAALKETLQQERRKAVIAIDMALGKEEECSTGFCGRAILRMPGFAGPVFCNECRRD